MAKKKTDYNVSLELKYKSRYRERFSAEIKAENADEAKRIFLAELAESNPTINLLFSIDESFEEKVLNTIKCDDVTAFLEKKAAKAKTLLGELKTALVSIKDISPKLLERFEDDYRSLRSNYSMKDDKALENILSQCAILLESIEKCARLNNSTTYDAARRCG